MLGRVLKLRRALRDFTRISRHSAFQQAPALIWRQTGKKIWVRSDNTRIGMRAQ